MIPERDVVNGIDVRRLRDAMDAIRDNPNFAGFRFRARNRWMGGTHCRTTIRNFDHGGQEDTSRGRSFALDADEPDVLLGQDHGPNATEAALYALSSCLSTTFIYHAAARGITVRELEIDLEGDLDIRGILGMSDQVRNGYETVRATFRVKADASPDQIEELCRLAQQRSPVFDIFTNPIPVTARVEIV